MSEPDLKAQIEAIKLTTKAAKLRKLMPSIEAKLAEGVRAVEIVETLRKGGVDMTMGTFRNYLHQYRVKQHGKAVERQATPVDSRPPEPAESVSYETDSAAKNESGGPVSMQELDRLMKPDPAKQAEDLAHYERLAKQQRRSRDK